MNNSTNRINSWAFCQYNACPNKTSANGGISQSLLNTLSIINRCSWQRAYEDLLSVALELGVMPGDPHCVKALLAKYGFFLQPKVKETVSIEDFCRAMDTKCHDGQLAVIQVQSRRLGAELLAVVPGEYSEVIGRRGSTFAQAPNTLLSIRFRKYGSSGKTDRIIVPSREERGGVSAPLRPEMFLIQTISTITM